MDTCRTLGTVIGKHKFSPNTHGTFTKTNYTHCVIKTPHQIQKDSVPSWKLRMQRSEMTGFLCCGWEAVRLSSGSRPKPTLRYLCYQPGRTTCCHPTLKSPESEKAVQLTACGTDEVGRTKLGCVLLCLPPTTPSPSPEFFFPQMNREASSPCLCREMSNSYTGKPTSGAEPWFLRQSYSPAKRPLLREALWIWRENEEAGGTGFSIQM